MEDCVSGQAPDLTFHRNAQSPLYYQITNNISVEVKAYRITYLEKRIK